MEGIGPRIQTAREAQRMKQVELARATGLHYTAISNLENGWRKPNVEHLYKLCFALRCSADEILNLPKS